MNHLMTIKDTRGPTIVGAQRKHLATMIERPWLSVALLHAVRLVLGLLRSGMLVVGAALLMGCTTLDESAPDCLPEPTPRRVDSPAYTPEQQAKKEEVDQFLCDRYQAEGMLFQNIRRNASLLLLFSVACGAERGSAETPTPTVTIDEARRAPPSPTPVSSPTVPDSSPAPEEASTEPAESAEKRACDTDGDCFPDFCDRGVCAEVGKGKYGWECTLPLPPQPKRPEPPLPPNVKRAPKAGFPESACGAYLCVDKRCRSCQSNAECGSAPSTCESDDGFPGKRCGIHSKEPFPKATPPPSEPIPGVPPLPFTQQPTPPFLQPRSSGGTQP